MGYFLILITLMTQTDSVPIKPVMFYNNNAGNAGMVNSPNIDPIIKNFGYACPKMRYGNNNNFTFLTVPLKPCLEDLKK